MCVCEREREREILKGNACLYKIYSTNSSLEYACVYLFIYEENYFH